MFWSHSDKTVQDPKRAFAWILVSNNIPSWICTKVTKPSFEVSDIEHSYLNFKFSFPGRVSWNKIALTLVDPLTPDAAATIMATLEEGGYRPPTGPNQLQTISKGKSVSALGGTTSIRQVDSNSKTMEEWTLVNAWISSAKFGELDYESDNLTNIELELTYDFAYVKTAGKAVQGGNAFPTNWAK